LGKGERERQREILATFKGGWEFVKCFLFFWRYVRCVGIFFYSLGFSVRWGVGGFIFDNREVVRLLLLPSFFIGRKYTLGMAGMAWHISMKRRDRTWDRERERKGMEGETLHLVWFGLLGLVWVLFLSCLGLVAFFFLAY